MLMQSLKNDYFTNERLGGKTDNPLVAYDYPCPNRKPTSQITIIILDSISWKVSQKVYSVIPPPPSKHTQVFGWFKAIFLSPKPTFEHRPSRG